MCNPSAAKTTRRRRAFVANSGELLAASELFASTAQSSWRHQSPSHQQRRAPGGVRAVHVRGGELWHPGGPRATESVSCQHGFLLHALTCPHEVSAFIILMSRVRRSPEPWNARAGGWIPALRGGRRASGIGGDARTTPAQLASMSRARGSGLLPNPGLMSKHHISAVNARRSAGLSWQADQGRSRAPVSWSPSWREPPRSRARPGLPATVPDHLGDRRGGDAGRGACRRHGPPAARPA